MSKGYRARKWHTVDRRRQGKIQIQERLDHTGLKITRWTCSACSKWAYYSESDAQCEAVRFPMAQWVYQCRGKFDPPRWHLTGKRIKTKTDRATRVDTPR